MKTLLVGGARSGKSRHAQLRAAAHGLPVTCIATARAGDAEMDARISVHRATRPAHWHTVEEPIALGAALAAWSAPDRVVVVDCLTLWLANVLFDGGVDAWSGQPQALPPLFVREYDQLLQALRQAPGPVYLVSNEVGLGVVPLGAGTRLFVDEAGRMNQQIGALCDEVLLVVSGFTHVLKGATP